MTSRVTFSQMSNNVKYHLFNNYRKLDETQQQLATGRRLNKPSDAPIDVANDLELRSTLHQVKQYQRNMEDGMAFMAITDTSLTNMNNLYQAAREKAIQGASDTNSSQDRAVIALEVRSHLEQLVAMANTTFKGDFIFSGANTQLQPYEIKAGKRLIDATDDTGTDPSDTFLDATTVNTPLRLWDDTISDSADAPNGKARVYDLIPGSVKISGLTEKTDYTVDHVAGTVTFLTPAAEALAAGGGISVEFDWIRRNEGDLDRPMERQVDDATLVRMNLPASQVFGARTETTAFDGMIKVVEGLLSDNGDEVRQGLQHLDASFKRSLSAQADNGSRVNRFESSDERSRTQEIDTTRLQSNLEDLDFAEAISRWQLQQAVYDASLRTGARVVQHTLADFL